MDTPEEREPRPPVGWVVVYATRADDSPSSQDGVGVGILARWVRDPDSGMWWAMLRSIDHDDTRPVWIRANRILDARPGS